MPRKYLKYKTSHGLGKNFAPSHTICVDSPASTYTTIPAWNGRAGKNYLVSCCMITHTVGTFMLTINLLPKASDCM